MSGLGHLPQQRYVCRHMEYIALPEQVNIIGPEVGITLGFVSWVSISHSLPCVVDVLVNLS